MAQLTESSIPPKPTYYNQQRPHRALDDKTPLVAFNARIKAKPALPEKAIHFGVRRDKVDGSGRVTLRCLSQLRHIYVGTAYKRQTVQLLIAGDHVRVVREDGRLLRELTLDPSRDYEPLSSVTLFQDVVRHGSGPDSNPEPCG
jgi:hypothetical protein